MFRAQNKIVLIILTNLFIGLFVYCLFGYAYLSTFRYGKGVHYESRGQRISRDDEHICQWTSVYELEKREKLHNIGVVDGGQNRNGRKLLSGCSVYRLERTLVCN